MRSYWFFSSHFKALPKGFLDSFFFHAVAYCNFEIKKKKLKQKSIFGPKKKKTIYMHKQWPKITHPNELNSIRVHNSTESENVCQYFPIFIFRFVLFVPLPSLKSSFVLVLMQRCKMIFNLCLFLLLLLFFFI